MSYIIEKIKDELWYILGKWYFYWFLNGLKWWWEIKGKLLEIYNKKEELNLLMKNITENNDNIKSFEFDLSKLNDENTKIHAEIKIKESEILNIKEDLIREQVSKDKLLEKVWEVSKTLEWLNEKVKDLNNEKNEINLKKERLTVENNNYTNNINKLELEIKNISDSNESLKKSNIELETKNNQLENSNRENSKELQNFEDYKIKLKNELNDDKMKNENEHKKLMQDATNYYNSGQELKKQYELKLEDEKIKELNKWKNIHLIHEKNTEEYFTEHFGLDISMNINFIWYNINWNDLKPDVSIEYLYWDNKYLILFDAKTSRSSPDFSIDDIEDNKEFSWKINNYIRSERKKIEKYTVLKKIDWIKLYNTFYLVIPDEYFTFVDNKLLTWKFWNYNVEVISLSSSKTVLDYIVKRINEVEELSNIYGVEDKDIDNLNKYLVDVTKTAIFSSNINFQLWKFGVNITDRYEWLHENIKRKVSSESTTFKWKLSLDTWTDTLNKNLSEFLPKAKEIFEKNEKEIYKKLK